MIYSHEVEMSRTSSDPGRGEMGKSKRDQRYLRFYTRRRLVCTSAGSM